MALSELAEGRLGGSAGAASADVPAIERLDLGDVDGGLALSDATGWNQTGDDWRVFLAHGEVVGCRDRDGRLVATAAALPFDARTGWISMVLVDAGWRHRGLATALLSHCIDSLRRSGRAAVLDATPAGAPVYRRLGFAAGFAFDRWQGHGAVAAGAPPSVAATSSVDRPSLHADAVVALDADAGGVERGVLLRDIVSRAGSRTIASMAGDGVVVSRAGRRATQVGPLVAASDADAVALAGAALDALSGAVFIDVPQHGSRLADELSRRGFTRQRAFTRMALGGDHLLVARPRVHALVGPEFG